MGTVKEAMDNWGRAYLNKHSKTPIPEGASITFTENQPDSWGYCETCGPDPFTVEIRCESYAVQWYGTLGEIIQEILKAEAARV